jgi:NADH:ubiquinone oxidoreductase subunit E
MPIQKILLEFEPQPENMLRVLKEINKQEKYISESDCRKVAGYFSLPLARVFSLASFFDLLDTRSVKKKIIKVCSGGPCSMKRSLEIIRQIEMLLKIELGKDSYPKTKLETMSCVGLCDQGPVMMIDEHVFEKVRPEMVDDIILNYL